MMSSFFEEYHSALAKTCKENSLWSRGLLASTVIFNKLWAKLYLQYLHVFLIQVIHGTNEAMILFTSFKNTTCQDMRHGTGAYHNGIAF